MDNSNSKSEPVDKQPTSEDDKKTKDKTVETAKEAIRYLYHSLPHPRHYSPSRPPRPSSPPLVPYHKALPPHTTRADFITPDQRAICGPPVEPLEKADKVELPYHKTLPPRTTRADFITPDQRAIFGPPVEPLEIADKVEPDGL